MNLIRKISLNLNKYNKKDLSLNINSFHSLKNQSVFLQKYIFLYSFETETEN